MSTEDRTPDYRASSRDIDVFDYLAILWSWRRFLFVNVTVIMIVCLGIVLMLPKWYKSTASILPPKEQGILGQLGAAGSILKSFTGSSQAGGALSGGSSSYNFLAVLKSRTVMETIIEEFDLRTVYEVPENSLDKTLRELEGNAEFDVQPEDNITIDVWDKDPQRAADMANAFVRLLNSTSIRLATTEARNNRLFIGERLESIRSDLRAAEDALQEYQETSGMMIIPDENMSGLSVVAELYAMKVQKELELAVLRRTVGAENPALRPLSAELEEINAKVSTIPQAGIESIRYFRDVLIQQKILEFVLPLYEQAKVDEQKTVPVILVLDEAKPAERHDKPKRLYVLVALGLLAFIMNAFVVFVFVSLMRRQQDENPVASGFESFVRRVARLYRVR